MGKDEALNEVSRYRDRGEPSNVTSIEQRLRRLSCKDAETRCADRMYAWSS